MPIHPVIVMIGTATFSCYATVKAPPIYHAAKTWIAKPAPRSGDHAKHNRQHHAKPAAVVPVCPPSGITTLNRTLPTADPLAMMDDDVEEADRPSRSYSLAPPAFVPRSSYEITRPDLFAPYVPQPVAPGVGLIIRPTPTPTTEPEAGNPATPLPEPETWALMLAGFALVGAVARHRAQRSCTVPAM